MQTGYDFVGNKYGSVPGAAPEPDNDPYDDCAIEDASDGKGTCLFFFKKKSTVILNASPPLLGHGTSTSGIIGGYDLANVSFYMCILDKKKPEIY